MKKIFSFNTLEILHAHTDKSVTEDIKFFSNKHKHLLNIKTIMTINDDEVLDNYLFRKFIEQLLNKISFDIDNRYYDDLARYIRNKIIETFSNHDITIEITDDNNSGYIFSYDEIDNFL